MLRIKSSLLLFLWLGLCAQAQEFVSCDYPRYLFHHCPGKTCDTGNIRASFWTNGETIFHYPSVGRMEIYGLAVPVDTVRYRQHVEEIAREYHQEVLNSGWMVIYNGGPHTQLQFLDEVYFSHDDFLLMKDNTPKRVIHTYLGYPIDPRNTAYPYSVTMHVLEFYFPRPVVVEGDFFAGFKTGLSSSEQDSAIGIYSMNMGEISCNFFCDCNDKPDTQWVIYRQWEHGVDDPPTFLYSGTMGNCISMRLYWPILLPPQYDSAACSAPAETPQLIDCNRGGCYASVMWVQRAPEQGLQQLAIAPWPSSPDSAVLIDRNSTQTMLYTFSNLDTTQTYAVWLRDECCHHVNVLRDTAWWSPWSEPLIFSFGSISPDTLWLNDSTYVLGGDTIVVPHEGISSLFPNPYSLNIFPNPTTGEVMVECGEWSVERIEVLDPQGRLLMEKEYSLSPKTYSLNLSSLPKGSYLLRIHTGQGTITRKVARE